MGEPLAIGGVSVGALGEPLGGGGGGALVAVTEPIVRLLLMYSEILLASTILNTVLQPIGMKIQTAPLISLVILD